MTWPPAAIAADKTNDTPAVGDHPAHHNLLATVINAIVAWLTSAKTFYLRNYCVGDGATDDSAGFRQAVIDAEAYTASSGKNARVLGDPGRTYLLNDWVVGMGGQAWIVQPKGDRLKIIGRGAKIKSTSTPPPGFSSQVFFPNGAGRLGDAGDFTTANTWYPVRPMVALSGSYAKGAVAVTVASGAGFAAGDFVYIRTGEVFENGPSLPPLWPDSELNEVHSVAGNVLTLRYPLSKPFAQEYYVTGTNGVTSTAVTANAAPYGVHKVTDCTIRGFSLLGWEWDCPLATYLCLVHQAVDVTLDGYTGTFGVCGTAVQYTRRSRQSDYRMLKGNAATNGAIVAGAACGSNDVLVDDVHAYGPYPCFIHMHEGVADWTVDHSSVLTSPEFSFSQGGFGARLRTYGGRLLNSTFVGGTRNGVLVVDASCVAGGLIEGCTVHCLEPSTTADAAVEGQGWVVVNNLASEGIAVAPGNLDFNNQILGQAPFTGFNTRYTMGSTNPILGSTATPAVTHPLMEVTGSTDITTLTGGRDGERVTLLFVSGTRKLKSINTTGRFFLAGGVDVTPTFLSVMEFVYVNGSGQNWWVEVSRVIQ